MPRLQPAFVTAWILTASISAAQPAHPPPPSSLERLRANIERTTPSVNATWNIYVKSLDPGDTLTVQDLITLMNVVPRGGHRSS